MIEIKMLKDADFKGFTFIEGFPGTGLVGPMAISYIIDKLGLSYVGYIDSEEFPPLVSVHGGTPMKPVRLYYSDKYKVCTVFAEFAIPVNAIYALSDAVYSFIKKNKFGMVVSIGGIPQNAPSSTTAFAIASTPKTQKLAKDSGLSLISDGVSIGVSALLLSNAAMDSLDDIDVLVPVSNEIIDPKYAELAIIALNKMMKLSIDIADLEKEAKEVEAKIKDLMKKGKDTHDTYKKVVSDTSPSMYA